MPADLLPHLFRKFSRIEGGGQGSGIAGLGLGLAICKGLVEAHGGRIWAESDGPGLGARFTSTPSRRAVEEQVRILAVDDDPQALRYVPRRPGQGGLRAHRDRRPGGRAPPHGGGETPPGPAGPDAAGERRDRADAGHPADGGGAGHLRVGVRPGGGGRQGLRPGSRRLRGQAPFSPTELAARIRAALRKRAAPEWPDPPGPYLTGDLRIDYAERRVSLAGRPLRLTATEYELLYWLSVNAGRVLTHDQLLQRVWGQGRSGEPWLVRNLVKRLRRKLGDDADNPTYIFTEPRAGYRMARAETPEQVEP